MTFKDGDIHLVFEHGTGRAAFYIEAGSDVVYVYPDGLPAFHIKDNWLHCYDGSKATLYMGEPLDGEPVPTAGSE